MPRLKHAEPQSSDRIPRGSLSSTSSAGQPRPLYALQIPVESPCTPAPTTTRRRSPTGVPAVPRPATIAATVTAAGLHAAVDRGFADALLAAWGRPGWSDVTQSDAPHEAGLLKLNIDKAMEQLDWRPVWPFAETIQLDLSHLCKSRGGEFVINKSTKFLIN